jgi:hypothetical protein
LNIVGVLVSFYYRMTCLIDENGGYQNPYDQSTTIHLEIQEEGEHSLEVVDVCSIPTLSFRTEYNEERNIP